MDPIFSQNPESQPKIAPVYPVPSATRMDPEDFPLRAVCAAWIEKINKAADFKRAQFGKDAAECMKFFNGPYDWLYKSLRAPGDERGSVPDVADLPEPSFKMTCNKVAEAVQLFGPVLYHKNPHRQVNPRKLPELPFGLLSSAVQDPAALQMIQFQEQQMMMAAQQQEAVDKARAALMEWMLNYTPGELNLKFHSRDAIDEALIKGAGVLWLEAYQPKGSNLTLFGSFYDSVDNLQLDPDMETLEECKWIARRRVGAVWEVERRFGLAPGTLKPQIESFNQQGVVNADPDGGYQRARGMTNDLFVYWEVYSKMGVGGRLSGTPKEYRDVLEQFGDFAYIVVAEGTPFPLNVPNQLMSDPNADILTRFEWPVPVWMDDAWPMKMLAFHRVPRQLWPMSHFKPALGELKFLNWAYSHLASKIRVTCRDWVAMKKSAGDELKDRILHGRDLTLLEIEATHPQTISELVQFLQHPEMNGDIWRVIQQVAENFDKRTGLTELMYGQSAVQLRSASEANLKSDAMNVRPDDMANKVEDWMTEVAKNEAIAVHWHTRPEDVAQLMGPSASFYWGQLISSSNPFEMTHQLQYTIEANSTKKANRDRDAANFNGAMQNLAQPLLGFGQSSGNFQPYNALVSGWAKTMDLDANSFLIPNFVPPPLPPESAPPAGKEGKAA